MKCPLCQGEFSYQDAKIRTIPENRYYWGVVIKLLTQHLGYNDLEMHEIIKGLFLGEHKLINTKSGIKDVTINRSTTELTTIDFERLMSQIRIWASAELNVFIPEPNEEIDDKVYSQDA